jgi:hypothetical protein
MSGAQPILETERLALRPLVPDDLDALAALYGDPEVRRYFPEGTLTYEETRQELEWIIDVYERYGFGLCATILLETAEVRCFRCNPAPDHSPRRDVRSAISTTDIVRTPFPIRVALRRQLPPSFAFEEQGDQGAHDERPEEGAEAQDRHVRERDREREQRP